MGAFYDGRGKMSPAAGQFEFPELAEGGMAALGSRKVEADISILHRVVAALDQSGSSRPPELQLAWSRRAPSLSTFQDVGPLAPLLVEQ
jgi:hypothetical protein